MEAKLAILESESGTPGRTRTCDTRFRKPLLYPLSYRGLPQFSPIYALPRYSLSLLDKIYGLVITMQSILGPL